MIFFILLLKEHDTSKTVFFGGQLIEIQLFEKPLTHQN